MYLIHLCRVTMLLLIDSAVESPIVRKPDLDDKAPTTRSDRRIHVQFVINHKRHMRRIFEIEHRSRYAPIAKPLPARRNGVRHVRIEKQAHGEGHAWLASC